MQGIRFLKDAELRDKKVLLRLDCNVTIKDGKIEDDYRIVKSIPTIQYILDHGGYPIIISHHTDAHQSLKPVVEYLSGYYRVTFIPNIYHADSFQDIGKHGNRWIYICENLRFQKGEESNDFEFARFLSSLGDVYVNDAFGVSHREHASIVTLPKLTASYAGLLMQSEIEHLEEAFSPKHPFLFILAGGKPETKFPLIKKFLLSADHIFVGGAVANNFYQDAFGYDIGHSLYKHVDEDVKALWGNGRVMVPEEVVVYNESGVLHKNPKDVKPEDKILDIGPGAFPALKKVIDEAAFILWNGPLGDYMIEGFEKGTLELMKILVDAKAEKIVGGGDTVTLIMRENLQEKFDFISTGGGAMLQFLADGTLPGIDALKKPIQNTNA